MSDSTASLLFISTVAIVRGLLIQRHRQDSESLKAHAQHCNNLSLPSPDQTLNLLRNRRSIFTKQFTGDAVPKAVIDDMLEAAQWAPNHHLTEPWIFYVYESVAGRGSVGHLLQDLYKSSCAPQNDGNGTSKPFSQAKFDKKLRGAMLSSHIIAICVKTKTKNPLVEEIASVAMSVQNMHLVAANHGYGAYWSSGGAHSPKKEVTHEEFTVANPKVLKEFFSFDDDEPIICLGWLYVGDYYGTSNEKKKRWPSGVRSGMKGKVIWR